jgi:Tfp pilus assembly protein PilF
MGEDSGAEESYRLALELSPGNGRVWNNYGVLHFGQSRFDDARKAFEKAVALVPDFDDALYNLRDTYEALGRVDDMKKCADILIRRGVH